ncbi:MAG: methyltransferase domain-containing protein [Clostridia bacterium]|nr:methyltransferase domain-containing protein [Clostridia bacterium]
MKPDYRNWMPKDMIHAFMGAAAAALALCLVTGCTGLLAAGTLKTVLTVVFAAAAAVFCGLTIWSILMHRAFDYNGRRRMSAQIIEGTAAQVSLPAGGRCLDVGCGSGALAIAVAKRNPQASVIGIDRWGKEYSSFSKTLCEKNAKAEGVANAVFRQGDATHLDFPDETFDAVVSNYVYHNIPGDRQQYLLETLRTLKTGGTFAIHDIFSKAKYGDMQAFLRKLREMGYKKAELIDTANGRYMTRFEAGWMALSGSALLTGVK